MSEMTTKVHQLPFHDVPGSGSGIDARVAQLSHFANVEETLTGMGMPDLMQQFGATISHVSQTLTPLFVLDAT